MALSCEGEVAGVAGGQEGQKQEGDVVEQQPEGAPQETQAEGAEGNEEEQELAIKKQVWQLRVVQRRSAAKVVEFFEDEVTLDEAIVEQYMHQVEALRSRLGIHWTWFEEELREGRHDHELRPLKGKSGAPDLAAPSADDVQAFPGLPTKAQEDRQNPQRHHKGKKGTKWSPLASPKTSPKMKPAPMELPEAHDIPPLPTVSASSLSKMPPKEVWMAANQHRKTNFLAQAILGNVTRPGGHGALFSILAFCEVAESLGLAMSSRAFSAALLEPGEAEKSGEAGPARLWRLLGLRALGSSMGETGIHETKPDLPFEGDPLFKTATWARQQSFVSRIGRGLVGPSALTGIEHQLSTPTVELGPFLPAVAEGVDGWQPHVHLGGHKVPPGRLLVCDGKQNFHILDVGRRREEEVQVDRFHSRRLHSSLGVHPAGVAASWPLSHQAHCAASGGVVAVHAPTKGGGNPKDAPAFQWLELPDFGQVDPKLLEEEETTPPPPPVTSPKQPSPKLGASGGYPKGQSPSSPSLGPKSNGKSGNSRSPTLKASMPPQAPRVVAPPPLLRSTVNQGTVCAAIGKRPEGPQSVVVEAAWPLQCGRLVLEVRENVLAGAGHAHGSQKPGQSPTSGPHMSPQVKPHAPPKRPSGTQQATLELPQAGIFDDEAETHWCQAVNGGGRWWLQVWGFPAAVHEIAKDHVAQPKALASSLLTAPVTCLDSGTCGEGRLRLLCGLKSGGVELRTLADDRDDAVVADLPVESASVGQANAPPSVMCRQVLLRGGSAAIIAQAKRVTCHSLPLGKQTALSLLSKDTTESLRVAHLRPVGELGFAVCTDTHVYAFQVSEAGPAPRADLLSKVELPWASLAAIRERSPLAHVTHFEATLYEFLAVLNPAVLDVGSSQNAVCGLWPVPNLPSKEAKPAEASLKLKSWIRPKGALNGEVQETCAPAVSLASVLFSGQDSGPLEAIALHRAAPGDLRSGLLAASVPGVGLRVFSWGVEANPELARIRQKQQERNNEAARLRQIDDMERKLQRLKVRLQETDRLEEKAKEKGLEALTPEEQAKLNRRQQVEIEVERLSRELGLDEEDSEEDEEANTNTMVDTVVLQKRREKEKQQKEYHESKRALQKDRRNRRDAKYT